MSNYKKELLSFLSFLCVLIGLFVIAYSELLPLSNFNFIDLTPFYSADRAFTTFLSAWQPDSLGRAMFGIPAHFFHGILAGIFQDPDLAQKVYWLSLQPLAGIAMYIYLRYSGFVKSKKAIWLGSLIYAVNPVTVAYFTLGTHHMLVVYALLPFLLLFFFRMLRARRPMLDLLAFTFILGLSNSLQRDTLFIVAPAVALGLIIYWITCRNWKNILRSLGLTILSFTICLLLMLPFYAPLLVYLEEYRSAALLGQQETVQTMEYIYRYSTFSNTFRLLGWHLDYWSSYLNKASAFLFILPLLAIPSFFSKDREKLKYATFYSLLFVSVLSFMWLTKQHLLTAILSRLNLLLALKESGKIMALLPLALAPLITISFELIFEQLSRLKISRRKLVGKCLPIAIILPILAAHISGNWIFLSSGDEGIADTMRSRWKSWGDDLGDMYDISAPPVFQKAQNWLTERENNEEFFRILWFPIDDYSYPLWRQMYEGIYYPYTAKQDDNVAADTIMHIAYANIREGDLLGLADLLSQASVKYVIINKQSKWEGEIRPGIRGELGLNGSPQKFIDIFDNAEDFRSVEDNSDFAAYQNIRFTPHISLFSSANLVVVPDLKQNTGYSPSIRLKDNLVYASSFEEMFEKNATISNSDTLLNWRNGVVVNGNVASDNYHYMEGTGSVIIEGDTDKYGNLIISYTSDVPLDLSCEEGIAFWFKCNSGNLVYYRVRLIDASENVQWMDFSYTTPKKWEFIQLSLLLPSGRLEDFDISKVTKIDFWVKGDPSTRYTFWIDDVQSGNGWFNYWDERDALIDTDVGNTDSSSLKVHTAQSATGKLGAIHQTIPVESGAQYIISGWTRIQTSKEAQQQPNIRIKFYDGSWPPAMLDDFVIPFDIDESNEWQFQEVPRTSHPEARIADVIIMGYSNSDEVGRILQNPIWFDDIGFWEVFQPETTTLLSRLTNIYQLPFYESDEQLVIFKTLKDFYDEPWLFPAVDTITISGNVTLDMKMMNLLKGKNIDFVNEFEADFLPETGVWNTKWMEGTSNNHLLYSLTGGEVSRKFIIPEDGYFKVSLSSFNNTNQIIVGIDSEEIEADKINSKWYETDEFFMTQGEHEITINSSGESYLDLFALYSSDKKAVPDFQPVLEILQESRTGYQIHVDSNSPVFIYLGDTYHPSWSAYDNGELKHFSAFWWGNGFYLENAHNTSVEIEFTRQDVYSIIILIWALSWITLISGIIYLGIRRYLS